ncbi:hypothetical protein AVEN_212649-1 [Araneus ventricosus]|uniref:Uncharacterized protein n=1 Tax=Araneus ventricosus TaxID=182803 RepID=A0A4Y2RN84_ARAVE|nr:hypothetical protein AVEN_212649-1 [Araneus ventricosus]
MRTRLNTLFRSNTRVIFVINSSSDDEEDSWEPVPSLRTPASQLQEDIAPSTDFKCIRPLYTPDLQWNPVRTRNSPVLYTRLYHEATMS